MEQGRGGGRMGGAVLLFLIPPYMSRVYLGVLWGGGREGEIAYQDGINRIRVRSRWIIIEKSAYLAGTGKLERFGWKQGWQIVWGADRLEKFSLIKGLGAICLVLCDLEDLVVKNDCKRI